MARPLSDFISILQNKGMRITNMWEVEITSGYKDVDDKLKNITLYAEGFEAPERKQETVDVPFKGYPLVVPSKITMGNEHTVKVRCDINGDIRRVFLKWMNYITDANIAQGSFFGGEKRIPKSAFIRIRMLNMDMATPTETYKIFGCIPTDVGNLAMSNVDATVASFDVKFKSQYWEVESTTGDFPEQK